MPRNKSPVEHQLAGRIRTYETREAIRKLAEGEALSAHEAALIGFDSKDFGPAEIAQRIVEIAKRPPRNAAAIMRALEAAKAIYGLDAPVQHEHHHRVTLDELVRRGQGGVRPRTVEATSQPVLDGGAGDRAVPPVAKKNGRQDLPKAPPANRRHR